MSLKGFFSRKNEEERLESSMVESFRSPLSLEVRRTQQRLARRAEDKPLETVTLLLRQFDNEDIRVHKAVKDTLSQIARTKEGMEAILVDMVHPSRNVRKAVQSFLGSFVGAHAVTYASFYEQTMLLVAMARRKDIPVDDIVSLADLSKRTFIEGEVMEAVKDIGYCLDSIKHRYRSSEQLKEYVADLLKMAPDLTRMGVYSGAIEEPLRKAMKASRYRDYDETKEIIEERARESRLRTILQYVGRAVKDNINARPLVKREDLDESDLEVLTMLHDLVDTVTSLVLARKRKEAVDAIASFMEGVAHDPRHSEWQDRVRDRDPSAMFALYNVTLVCLKLTSSIMPITAEDIYQQNLRHLEGDPSIHVVMWPDVVMKIMDGEIEERTAPEAPA